MSIFRSPPEYLRWLVLSPRVDRGYDVLPFVDEQTARDAAEKLGLAMPKLTIYVVLTRWLT